MILDKVLKIISNLWLSKAIALLRQCIKDLQNVHLNLLNAVNVLCNWISWDHQSLVSSPIPLGFHSNNHLFILTNLNFSPAR